MPADLTKLSKTISHALRHEPQLYNLQLDNEGWVNLSLLVDSLRSKGWKDLQREDIILIIEKSEKKRFQIVNDKIRAYYGHSTDEKIVKHQQVPPDILYHGTSTNNIDSIMIKGLLPMDRQYVHLSEDKATAEIVANRRKKSEVCILTIHARQAHENGIAFYREENGIWLSDLIESKYIKV